MVTLKSFFAADPVPAARYYKPVYESTLAANNIRKRKLFYAPEMRLILEYNFRIQPGQTFPLTLCKKLVSEYLLSSVSSIEMKEVFEEIGQ